MVLVGKSEEKRQLVRPGRRWEKILKWTFKKQDGGRGLDLSGSELGQVRGSSEHSNELPVPKHAKNLTS
jgi:hypothetical protein